MSFFLVYIISYWCFVLFLDFRRFVICTFFIFWGGGDQNNTFPRENLRVGGSALSLASRSITAMFFFLQIFFFYTYKPNICFKTHVRSMEIHLIHIRIICCTHYLNYAPHPTSFQHSLERPGSSGLNSRYWSKSSGNFSLGHISTYLGYVSYAFGTHFKYQLYIFKHSISNYSIFYYNKNPIPLIHLKCNLFVFIFLLKC